MPSQVEIRDSLVQALQYDLIGPMEEGEVLKTRPSRWYLTGFLVPRQAPREYRTDPTATEELARGFDDDEDDSQDEPPAGGGQPWLPSSMGLSFLVPSGCFMVGVKARWAEYRQLSDDETLDLMDPEERATREERLEEKGQEDQGLRFRYWMRQPQRVVERQVPLYAGAPRVELDSQVTLQAVVRDTHTAGVAQGCRTVSMFLVNERGALNGVEAEEKTLFQVELEIVCEAGFEPRVVTIASGDSDERRNDLQFRHRREWAVGHGVSTRVVAPEEGRVTRLATTWLPQARVYRMAAAGVPGVELSMEALAHMADARTLETALCPLLDAYHQWIGEQRSRITGLDTPARQQTARELMDKADTALLRLRDGIKLLGEDPRALTAFRLTNLAMAQAARHARTYDVGDVPQWYLFQLAFLLINLRGVVDPGHPDRLTVDLLFFPTGGGKTEAYLGVAAFTLLMRRLTHAQDPHEGAGVAVLLRYTLRLLTLDQLGRAATLMCALEQLREKDPTRLGKRPLQVGLWVGSAATPNTLAHAREVLDKHKASAGRLPPPIPLVGCPWCRTPFSPESFRFEEKGKDPGAMRVGCANIDCAFSFGERPSGLPVVVVDEQLYRELPALLIATVDKFALLPWRGETGALFGRVLAMDSHGFYGWGVPSVPSSTRKIGPLPPPALIIQDELHLITGPLGTMVGLYETAIDTLCRDAHGHPPKILASTATVRRSGAQIRALYGRSKVAMFPPQGQDEGDTFFSHTDQGEAKARLYVGVTAPGRGAKRVSAHVATCLLAAAQHHWLGEYGPRSKKPVGLDNPADTYMTLVGYFNSLRELGGAQRLLQEEVGPRVARMEMRKPVGRSLTSPFSNRLLGLEVLELTSRQATGQIRDTKGRLEAPYGSDTGKKNDVVLASSMLSVGVDIDRLGLMVVHGQPRTVAEYIQASSRVGRKTPGLVVTLYSMYRPRDRSHYERFTTFHESFYRFVEATSVTPFSPRALERGLAGLTTTLVRHTTRGMTTRDGVEKIAQAQGLAQQITHTIAGRAMLHREGAPERLAQDISERIDGLIYDWTEIVHQLGQESRPMQYSPFEKKAGSTPLLSSAITPASSYHPKLVRFRAPTSMRDVEPSVHLWLGKTSGEEDS